MDTLEHGVITLVEFVGLGFDILGVSIILIGVVRAMIRYIIDSRRPAVPNPYRTLRNSVGMTLLLGLEVLVAADIVKTVAIEPNFTTVGVLALLVLVRTFLSWTLTLEIEGRWPWQRERAPEPETTEG